MLATYLAAGERTNLQRWREDCRCGANHQLDPSTYRYIWIQHATYLCWYCRVCRSWVAQMGLRTLPTAE
jgi:hypothetical protein